MFPSSAADLDLALPAMEETTFKEATMSTRTLFKAAQFGASLAIFMASTAPARADLVSDWGTRAIAIGTEKQMPNAPLTRGLAMMHVAMFEAVNAVERRYMPYKLDLAAHQSTSKEAAAATAAHEVLVQLYPDQKSALDQALAANLAAVPDGEGKSKGIELGKKSAAGIIALRADDGSTAQESYRPATKPGVYVPTALPIESTSGEFKPWVMQKGSQFRPGPPPTLDSDVWTRDYNEIREIGGAKSNKRTAEQTDMGRFWFLTGPRSFSPLVRLVADYKKMDLVDTARLYALVAMTSNDAFIAVFDAKYAYNFWRPITAIRNADQTGNAATPREASWTPLGMTPPHPEYPCAHCIVASAVSEVLQRVGGDDVGELTLTSAIAPGVTRKWKRLEDYSKEVSEARIFAGFHYRFSTEVANAMGKKIGELAATNQLRAAASPQTKK
jgi:hypothetical protein